MTLKDRLSELPAVDDSLVYGAPHLTPDGSTVITVSKPGFFRGMRPLGVFVIHEGKVSFECVTDSTRIALMGELIGLVAAGFATAALLRRPPWPDMSIHEIIERRSSRAR
ncbi:hypothetical protein HLB23_21595 [Nocardia uniformis]|uniref:Uncharacterized protein n=1 Tax=Nocardia uniformis TaxID=53432 RepID=A0A849CG52_9NOCA|nr:hypothetical protein [Nocardia uniformis]NNH72421.1 hypothetical protein [Nocardia uniformis]